MVTDARGEARFGLLFQDVIAQANKIKFYIQESITMLYASV